MEKISYFATKVTAEELNNWKCIDKYYDQDIEIPNTEYKGLYIKEYKSEEWGILQIITDIFHSIITFGFSERTWKTINYSIKGYQLHDIYLIIPSDNKFIPEEVIELEEEVMKAKIEKDVIKNRLVAPVINFFSQTLESIKLLKSQSEQMANNQTLTQNQIHLIETRYQAGRVALEFSRSMYEDSQKVTNIEEEVKKTLNQFSDFISDLKNNSDHYCLDLKSFIESGIDEFFINKNITREKYKNDLNNILKLILMVANKKQNLEEKNKCLKEKLKKRLPRRISTNKKMLRVQKNNATHKLLSMVGEVTVPYDLLSTSMSLLPGFISDNLHKRQLLFSNQLSYRSGGIPFGESQIEKMRLIKDNPEIPEKEKESVARILNLYDEAIEKIAQKTEEAEKWIDEIYSIDFALKLQK